MKLVAILLVGSLGLVDFTTALPKLPLPGNVLFSEYIATSMTGFFFNYIRRNNLDPTPATTYPFDISIDGVNARIDEFRFFALTRGTFIPVLGPVCLKEKTFTVSYCVANVTPFENSVNVFTIIGNYTASGTYGIGDNKVNVTGSGHFAASTYEDFPLFIPTYVCHWVDYSNISVSLTGKVDVSQATYTSGYSVRSIPYPSSLYTRLEGLSAGNYEETVRDALIRNIDKAVGDAGKGNPLAEVVDSFIRSLLGSTESLNGLSNKQDYLSASSEALKLPMAEATVASSLRIEHRTMAKNFFEERNSAIGIGSKANGCFLGKDPESPGN